MTPTTPEHPLVSILISSYNQKEYLNKAITSALNQSYPNIEIIISDDGSNDGSRDLIQSYINKHPKLIQALFAEKNRGIIANYNKMLSAGTGKYLLKMDGDDLIFEDHIESQVIFLENNPQFLGCFPNVEVFDSESDEAICLFINEKRPMRKGNLKNVIRYGCFFHVPFMLFRREAVPPNSFEKNAISVDDYLFMIKILKNGGEIGFLNKILGRYRIHGKNLTQSKTRLIRHTLWATMLTIIRYPKYTFDALFRIFDAGRAVITKRNDWL